MPFSRLMLRPLEDGCSDITASLACLRMALAFRNCVAHSTRIH
jgi:hypothetical protein